MKRPEPMDLFYERLADQCTCTPISDRPCAGLLAGGLCDDLQMGPGEFDDDDQEKQIDEEY